MLRILYVEDNAANLSLVHRVARLGGHEVVNRTSGESALADFASIRPDMVLMDVQLEGALNGLEVVEKLRADGYSEVPIIAVTAYAMKGDKEKAINAGCDDYLPKPLPIKDLVALIDKYGKLIEKHKTGEIESIKAHTPRSTQEETTATTQPPTETPPPQPAKVATEDRPTAAESPINPTAATAPTTSERPATVQTETMPPVTNVSPADDTDSLSTDEAPPVSETNKPISAQPNHTAETQETSQVITPQPTKQKPQVDDTASATDKS